MGPLVLGRPARPRRALRRPGTGRGRHPSPAAASALPKDARGFYYEPTLFTGVDNGMAIAREEIFGPVIAAIPFADEADVIAIANDSDFGLYGYIWSGDTARALRVARSLRTGTVQINGASPNPDAPFGGYKMSGVGRDGGHYAVDAYTGAQVHRVDVMKAVVSFGSSVRRSRHGRSGR